MKVCGGVGVEYVCVEGFVGGKELAENRGDDEDIQWDEVEKPRDDGGEFGQGWHYL